MSDLNALPLEDELHRLRPAATLELLQSLSRSLQEPPRRPGRMPRLALTAALSLAVAAALGATGGLSYAASSAGRAARVAQRAATPQHAFAIDRQSAGGDQYRPGYGFGDPNHNHDGPPGLTREKTTADEAAPVLQARATADRFGSTVTTDVTFDEQSHLYISVVDAADQPLLLTQRSKRGGSRIGAPVSGPQTKFIQYAVLVPRTIPMTLRIPANLLAPDATYRLRIVALDPQG